MAHKSKTTQTRPDANPAMPPTPFRPDAPPVREGPVKRLRVCLESVVRLAREIGDAVRWDSLSTKIELALFPEHASRFSEPTRPAPWAEWQESIRAAHAALRVATRFIDNEGYPPPPYANPVDAGPGVIQIGNKVRIGPQQPSISIADVLDGMMARSADEGHSADWLVGELEALIRALTLAEKAADARAWAMSGVFDNIVSSPVSSAIDHSLSIRLEMDALMLLGEREVWGVDELPAGIDLDMLRCLDEREWLEARYFVMQNQHPLPPSPNPSAWYSPMRKPSIGGDWKVALSKRARDCWNHPHEVRVSERGRAEISRHRRGFDAPPKVSPGLLAKSNAATDPGILDQVAERAVAKTMELMGAGDRKTAPPAKLPKLKLRDREAWQASLVVGMTQSNIADALNGKYPGENWTQPRVHEAIKRAKAHADASGLTDTVTAIRSQAPARTLDPAVVDEGQRTDGRAKHLREKAKQIADDEE